MRKKMLEPKPGSKTSEGLFTIYGAVLCLVMTLIGALAGNQAIVRTGIESFSLVIAAFVLSRGIAKQRRSS